MTLRLVLFGIFSTIYALQNLNNSSRNDALEGIAQHLGLKKCWIFVEK